ncbi:MAG: outer membrane protein assembly factor BamE domain-containing protein [Anaerolineales bacterium]
MATPGSKVRSRSLQAAALGGALAAGLLSGPGCAVMARRQTDQPVLAENVAKVQQGMTKGQVTDVLGAPQEIIFSNKEHDPLREHAYVFEYKVDLGTAIFFGLVNFGNLDQKRDRAIVFFDEGGKVAHVAKSLRADQARYGFPFGR